MVFGLFLELEFLRAVRLVVGVDARESSGEALRPRSLLIYVVCAAVQIEQPIANDIDSGNHHFCACLMTLVLVVVMIGRQGAGSVDVPI